MAAPPARSLTATPRGVYAIGAGCILASSPWWLPQPAMVALGAAFLAAAALAALAAHRSLRRVEALWLPSESPRAGEETLMAAELRASRTSPPFVLEWTNPMTRRPEVAARLREIGPTAVRPQWTARFPRRGVHILPALQGRCLQPFGLFESLRNLSPAGEILVLPALGVPRQALRARLSAWLEAHGLAREPGDDDLDRLRSYRPGDPLARIHWRASARNRRLLVGERNALGCRRLALAVDLRPAGSRRLERVLCAAATVIEDLAAQGWSVTLHHALAPQGVSGPPGRLHESLALARHAPGDPASFLPSGCPALVLGVLEVSCAHLRPLPLVLPDDELPRLIDLPRRLA
jgi:uncharacterized protein (DUF58 family)